MTKVEFESFYFPAGERHVRLLSEIGKRTNIRVRGADSDIIMDMLLLTDAIRRAGSQEISLHIPYLPYARQDRVNESNLGEPLSISVMAALINSQNYKRVDVLDCHSDVGAALINNCCNKSNVDFVKSCFVAAKWEYPHIIGDDYLLISPDQGASKKIQRVAKEIGYLQEGGILTGNKIRDMRTGQITGTSVENVHLAKGKDCVIIDDICDGGRTFTELAKVLKNAGASRVILIVTHGIFSNRISTLIEQGIDHIFCTDSYQTVIYPNVTQLSI